MPTRKRACSCQYFSQGSLGPSPQWPHPVCVRPKGQAAVAAAAAAAAAVRWAPTRDGYMLLVTMPCALGLMWARLRLTDGTTAPGLSRMRTPCLGGSLAPPPPPLVQLSAPPSEKATSSQGLVLLLLLLLLHGSPTLFESDPAMPLHGACLLGAPLPLREEVLIGKALPSSHLI